jgi:hypothetical protein
MVGGMRRKGWWEGGGIRFGRGARRKEGERGMVMFGKVDVAEG